METMLEYRVKSQKRDIEAEAENLKTKCGWLIRSLQETVSRIDAKDYVMINSCGVVQSNGTSIDLSVGKLRANIDALTILEELQKEQVKA
jgi:hypothetical protein